MTRSVTFTPTPELGRILEQAVKVYSKSDYTNAEELTHLNVLNAAVQSALAVPDVPEDMAQRRRQGIVDRSDGIERELQSDEPVTGDRT